MDSDSTAFAHVSIRIPEALRIRLTHDAEQRSISLNSLIMAILAKYDSFDKIIEGTRAIPFSGAFVAEVLDITSIEEMESIAKKLGANVVKSSFALRGIPFNLDNLIKFYFEPLSQHSGWYTFNTLLRRHEPKADLPTLPRREVDRVLETLLCCYTSFGDRN